MATSSLWRENIAALHFVSSEETLARHTTMKVGGPVALWAEPTNEEELSEILRRVWRYEAPFFVVGAGSNLVASDGGFDGVLLHLGKGFEYSSAQENCLVAGGAAFLPRLTHFCLENLLGNMEWACGIPGSLGGSLWGNAGSRGFNGRDFESRDCSHDFLSCVAFDRQGRRQELTRGDVEFAYRHTSLGELIVTEATFSLKPLSLEAAVLHKKAVRDLLERRRLTQPVSSASAGCIWKNPRVEGCAGAGALVEKLGLKGRSVGGAHISEIHGNFVVNSGNATAGDVRKLVRLVEGEVARRTGTVLVREARYVG